MGYPVQHVSQELCLQWWWIPLHLLCHVPTYIKHQTYTHVCTYVHYISVWWMFISSSYRFGWYLYSGRRAQIVRAHGSVCQVPQSRQQTDSTYYVRRQGTICLCSQLRGHSGEPLQPMTCRSGFHLRWTQNPRVLARRQWTVVPLAWIACSSRPGEANIPTPDDTALWMDIQWGYEQLLW